MFMSGFHQLHLKMDFFYQLNYYEANVFTAFMKW